MVDIQVRSNDEYLVLEKLEDWQIALIVTGCVIAIGLLVVVVGFAIYFGISHNYREASTNKSKLQTRVATLNFLKVMVHFMIINLLTICSAVTVQ